MHGTPPLIKHHHTLSAMHILDLGWSTSIPYSQVLQQGCKIMDEGVLVL